MDQKRTRYVILIEWIDSLPFGTEFNFNQAVKGVKENSASKEKKEISKQSLSSVLLPFCAQGLLCQRVVNRTKKFYSKTKKWNRQKAILSNERRLKEKYLRAKIKKEF